MVLMAASMLPALMSGHLIFAISSLISTVAGGVFVMKVNERSEYTVMITGIGMPGSIFCVAALNCLQNSMMFTPCWPSAGPTGGDGFAFAAGICSLTYACTFLAMSLLS